MIFTSEEIQSILLTFKLSFVVTIILIFFSTPLCIWLAKSRGYLSKIVNSIVTLPLILPPTVLGFYLLIFLSDNYFFDNFLSPLGINIQPFSFSGLVFASVIYSLPFAVQPILNGLQNLDQRYIEIAKINGLNKMDRFINVVLPLTYKNFLTAAILCFTHTIGEFGVILMIGGNIPGETKVLSIQIYEYVEILNYSSANKLGLFLIGLAFFTLFFLYCLQTNKTKNHLNNA